MCIVKTRSELDPGFRAILAAQNCMLLHEHEPLASDTSLFARSGNFRTYLTFLKIFVPLVDNGLGRIFHLRITLAFYSFRHQRRLIESPCSSLSYGMSSFIGYFGSGFCKKPSLPRVILLLFQG